MDIAADVGHDPGEVVKSFAVVSLMLSAAAFFAWYFVHGIRTRSFGSGASWPDQPLRFASLALAYLLIVFLLSWVALAGLTGLDPTLLALWPGLFGPIAALVLSRRHWGEPAPPPLLEAFAAHLRSDERESAWKVLRERAPAGPAWRLFEASLGAEPDQESALGYRSSAARRWTSVFDALDRALASERRRARLRLLPAVAAPGACWVLAARPPRADSTAAWVCACVELMLAALAVAIDHQRFWRHRAALSTLKAALRSG